MPDFPPSLMTRLKKHALPGLDIGDQFILPKYDDQSILNIPSTICKWMDIPGFESNPLNEQITRIIDPVIRKVILILMDGLSLKRFQRWQAESPVWASLIKTGVYSPLTSVVPSTTSSSLVTLWTGRSPATHGIIGYEMWLKEYAMVANMILHTPMAFRQDTAGSLKKAGFSPQSFLNLPTLGSHLRRHAVHAYAFSHYSIANSGLSQMLMTDVEVFPFRTPASLWVSVRELLENRSQEKMFTWVYWGQLDSISHHHGPDDKRANAEFSHFSAAFEQYFLRTLSNQAKQDTLVILTADHGQTHTALDESYSLNKHPQLYDYLRMKPTCENRFAFLYLRPGLEEAVRDYFNDVFPNKFTLISQEQAFQSSLFGPGPHHPDLFNRVGDFIAIAHEDAYLWWADQKDFLLGRHGGLFPDDMLVPFVAGRL